MRASYIWAVLITAGVGAWVLSGDIIVGGQGDSNEQQPSAAGNGRGVAEELQEEANERPFQVRVRTIHAEERVAELTVRGRTEADQRVTLRAQTSGLVEDIPVSKGNTVAAGDVICRIEAGSRKAQVLRAEASLAQAQLDYDATATLRERGHAAETRLRAAKATLDAAKASLRDAELDLERTEIRTSFDGVVEDIPAERGTLLGIGDACAEIVARDPMLVVGQVSERQVAPLEVGMPGHGRLVTGEEFDGTIGYISPSANSDTRTFRIELVVDNADGRLRDGVTAEVAIPLKGAQAHRFSPSILTLNDEGKVGVRAVDENNRVKFMPVDILGDTRDEVWVAGLPETVTIITVGQDYVGDGEIVAPVRETAEADQ